MDDTYEAVLRELSATLGARYSCIADAATRSILAERGSGDVDPVTVLSRGGCVTAGPAGGDDPDGLDELIVTAARSYHLLRPARAVRPLLVYVCLDRTRSNLALARRAHSSVVVGRLETAAGAVTWTDAEPPAQPAPSPGPTPLLPPPPAELPAPPAPRPLPVPLPRRSPAPVAAAPPAPPRPATGPRWADDVSTMRRLLAGLRALGNGS